MLYAQYHWGVAEISVQEQESVPLVVSNDDHCPCSAYRACRVMSLRPGVPSHQLKPLGKVLFRVNGIAAIFANDLDRRGHGNSITLHFSAPQGGENGVGVEPSTACMANTSIPNIGPAEQSAGLKDEQQKNTAAGYTAIHRITGLGSELGLALRLADLVRGEQSLGFYRRLKFA